MTVEDKIRAKSHWKMRVWITKRRRSRAGFIVARPDGTQSVHPTRKEALQALYAVIRCEPLRQFTLSVRKDNE